LPRIDGSGSAMEWRGVGDKPAKKREARLLTKGEQLSYSGCVKALPLAYSGPMERFVFLRDAGKIMARGDLLEGRIQLQAIGFSVRAPRMETTA
jgi:hypothetical protein